MEELVLSLFFEFGREEASLLPARIEKIQKLLESL
jgi:hypothetical protein